MEVDKNKIYSISEFVGLLNADLKWMKARIVGEVGEAKAGPTGHVYFTLKDEKDGSMLNCIMWASKYRLFGITLEPGKKIVAFGSPEIYAPNGRLSFICDTIELAGEGDIKKQYDELKKKLDKEGLFAPENKRPIPKYPRKIGLITSKQGAVIHDFLNNIGKFGFNIKMIDSRVEGQGAVEDLLSAIQTFRKKEIDILVIIRGGGSMESLMPFNNELLVREVAGFPVPVLVGIGHDKDVPLVALAADNSQSTPTAVANLLNESWEQALLVLERYERKIFASYGLIFEKFKKIENSLNLSLQKFRNNIANLKTRIEAYAERYLLGFNALLLRVNEKLKNAEKIISINNPERQLALGYSIATIKGKIIKKINDVKIGQSLEIKISDGSITSEIKEAKTYGKK
ncbi:MAG: exodeoxyribonuclease VII large subunit [Candidatus Staskawiczbacteria bacterium]|nr:exodeoxyribonuclease VII large subunit [Candidatus Staskawiczbacteria bacterium]